MNFKVNTKLYKSTLAVEQVSVGWTHGPRVGVEALSRGDMDEDRREELHSTIHIKTQCLA